MSAAWLESSGYTSEAPSQDKALAKAQQGGEGVTSNDTQRPCSAPCSEPWESVVRRRLLPEPTNSRAAASRASV
eukprot:4039653-Pyramimonas_sp.AAC.2